MAKQHIVDIKTSKFGFKYEKHSNAMKFGTQGWSSSLIINVIFEIADLDPKFKTDRMSQNGQNVRWSIVMCPIFMKFGTQHKSNMLITNMVLGIDDLDPK